MPNKSDCVICKTECGAAGMKNPILTDCVWFTLLNGTDEEWEIAVNGLIENIKEYMCNEGGDLTHE